MADRSPLNVDGLRRLLNVSPADMSDAEIRRALALLASDFEAHKNAEEAVQAALRVAKAIDRLEPL
jgi:hypothetical protein